MEKQNQRSGDHSTNIQSGQLTVNVGISYAEARQISLDVMKSELAPLTQVAFNTAVSRIEEYGDKLLSKIQERNPAAVQSFTDPAIQFALKDAQKEYAKTGDNDLAEVTIDLLIDRMQCEKRDRVSLVLDDALGKATKLTSGDLDALSVAFLFKDSKRVDLNNHTKLLAFLDFVKQFSVNASTSNASFQYIESLGCASLMQFSGISLCEVLRKSYPGLFAKGFSQEEIPDSFPQAIRQKIIIPCLSNPNLFQINALDDSRVEQLIQSGDLPEDIKPQMLDYLNNRCMNDEELKDKVLALNSEFLQIFDYWNNTIIKQLRLTSTGIMLAHANIRRRTNEKYDLSIWIN